MNRTHRTRLAGLAVGGGFTALLAPAAFGSSPLEYPDNGAAAFSRGGAWLAVGNEPIAAHYDPAALATQASAFSLDQNLTFNKVCYSRQGPGGAPESAGGTNVYLPACNARTGFPSTVPSISVSWRATEKLGFGFAIVPPSTYAGADNSYPPYSTGFNNGYAACVARLQAAGQPTTACGNQTTAVPASYRYMQLQQLSTILFPTISVGYEVLPHFRIGAGFISGIGVINNSIASIQAQNQPTAGTLPVDNPANDAISTLHTKDLFIPGIVVSLHWSPTPKFDLAAWGRYISPMESSQASLVVQTQPFGATAVQPTCEASRGPDCYGPAHTNLSPVNRFEGGQLQPFHFKFPFPPEVRAGIRFHLPRTEAHVVPVSSNFGSGGFTSRDPLHDDVFDVELDGSYSFNTAANTIEIRFPTVNGNGTLPVKPTDAPVPPNADIWNGFRNSVGLRLGGQYNVIRDKLGLRAGTWFETQSQDPAFLEVYPVGATRGGFGGGIVFRQEFIDISLGYQYQWSQGLDNGGVGERRAVQASGGSFGFNVNNNPPGSNASNYTQFRSFQTINDGNVTQHAHAFTLGGTVRF